MKEPRLKVSRVSKPVRGRYHSRQEVSSIRLSGQWLEEAGFSIGHQFEVEESPGRLVLVADWRKKMDEEKRAIESGERDVELGIAVLGEA